MFMPRKGLAGAAALAVALALGPPASATTIPVGANHLPIEFSNHSVPSGYTPVAGDFTSFSTGVSIPHGPQLAYTVSQQVYQTGTGSNTTFGFLYQVDITKAVNASVTNLTVGDFPPGPSGTVGAMYHTSMGVIPNGPNATRTSSTAGTISFDFAFPKVGTYDIFVTTQAKALNTSGSIGFAGTASGGGGAAFSPAPEPGALTLSLLALPVVGLVWLRHFRSRHAPTTAV
jgi:hypothetical protein